MLMYLIISLSGSILAQANFSWPLSLVRITIERPIADTSPSILEKIHLLHIINFVSRSSVITMALEIYQLQLFSKNE